MHCTEPCPQCPNKDLDVGAKPIVSGQWNDDVSPRVLFVGGSPNIEGSNRRQVLCGKAGEEFNRTYLPSSGLNRDQISITNAVKCYYAEHDDPPADLIRSCAEWHLSKELDRHKPDVVVLMGAIANSLLDLDVELEHGMMRKGSLLGWEGTIFSTLHPSMGTHKADAMLGMIDPMDGDFPRLKLLLRGQLQPLKDEYPDPEFERLTWARDVRAVMRHYDYFDPVAVDTESKKRWRGYPATERYTPFCATWCHEPGAAYMVKVEDEDAYREFGEQLLRFSTIVFHNVGHDHWVLSESGVYVPWNKTVCTMQMAYNDGRIRKGLKPMSYRLLGKRMISFDEVVIPHSRLRALEYYEIAMAHKWPAPIQEKTGDIVARNCDTCKGKGVFSLGRGKARKQYQCSECGATGKVMVPRMTRKQSLNDKLYRLATDMRKNTQVDLWERWNGWVEKDPIGMKAMIDALGPVPIPSIEYVPEGESIIYACGDAHETRRIYPVMQQRLIEIRRRFAA